ncbi:MAG: DUF3494 domain-containing protein [Candidatus Sericytochromatia bacterium]|nr:DUF3494 domain-containing protein [Candidatus Sericytochromatia bacterium]
MNLKSAANFAILAGSTVTNTGPTKVQGHLGLSPGSAVTGFPSGVMVPPSSIHISNATVDQAKIDLTAAFKDAANRSGGTSIAGEIGGLTLIPGVYSASSSVKLTGTLTLNGNGCADAVWIFQIPTTLTTASRSKIVLINGAKAANVFWMVGSSATLGTYAIFKGDIMAAKSITVTTGVDVEGRVLAQNAAVTLDTDNIHMP